MDHRTTSTLHDADGVEDWRVLDVGANAWFDAPSLAAGAALIHRVAALLDSGDPADGPLPDMDLRPGGVRVRIGQPGADGLTRSDVERARAISAAAREEGLAADPGALHALHLGIHTANPAALSSFWQTVLAYEPVGTDRLADPSRRNPAISFRGLDEPWPLRDRVHVDVVRASNEVEAARAALGLQPHGVYQLTLADPDGNEVDLVPGHPLSDGPGTADWRVLFSAMAFYPATSAVLAGELASAVAGLADDAGVPLSIDLRPDGVTIDSGKDQWDASEFPFARGFVDLAARIQSAARDMGLSADLTRLRFVQLAFDAVDIPAARAFWTSLLGYRPDPRTGLSDIFDPRRLDPVLMFQDLDADDDRRRQRSRIRIELVVPHDRAQPRVDAALASGGRLLARGPGRRTLTDPEGNEVDVLTSP